MSQQLVFLTLFLGLISGPGRVDLQVGPAIKSIRMLLDGRQVAVLQQPPWGATVDFGSSIVPGELVAAGYDAQGNEVARVKQTVNLPRPAAEFVIALKNDEKGTPVWAELRWEHLLAAKPVSSSLTVDGKSVPLDHMNARLPRFDMERPHVFAAQIQFEDGFVARRELVAGGTVSDTADAELTPIAVRQSTPAVPPANPGDCFTSAGSPVRVAAVEKSPALVIFVLDPDTREVRQAIDPTSSLGKLWTDRAIRHMVSLDRDTWMRVLWPVAEQFKTTSNSSAILFPPSKDFDASESGIVWLLLRASGDNGDPDNPRQAWDAAGVAGLGAITGAHRRAVVLIASRYKDASKHDAASIRNYLSSIGVPLFVWSFAGPRPELHDAWGDIEDVSSLQKLHVAAGRLRAELASQSVAWVAAGSVAALRLQPTGRCGITPLAHASR